MIQTTSSSTASGEPQAGLPDWKGFKVLGEITRTPRGILYKLRRKIEQDVIAAKFFDPSSCRKEFLDALPAASERAFLLDHKGLVRCLGCAQVERRPLLMMEYASGEPLSVILKNGQYLPPARALLIILQCATALRHAALQGLTHGRLHPADILVGEDQSRIVGVGLGDQPDHAIWSAPHPYAFEPLVYTAPEAMPSQKFSSALEVRAANDVYSLGAILAHMLTGTPPYAGRDESSLVDERRIINRPVQWPVDIDRRISKSARDITERMLANGAGLRPTYDELLKALTTAVADAEKFQNASALGITTNTSLFSPMNTNSSFNSSMTTAVAQPPVVGIGTGIGAAQASNGTPRPRVSRAYTTLLIGMTACVFLLALGLAGKIFLYDGLLSDLAKPAPSTPTPAHSAPALPDATAEPKSAEPGAARAVPPATVSLNNAEYAAATRQLEVIQELLKDGEIKHTAALRRRVLAIADKAGRDTPAGVKALLLADEIEESISGLKPAPEQQKPLVATEIPVIPGVGKAGGPMPPQTPAGTQPEPNTKPATVQSTQPVPADAATAPATQPPATVQTTPVPVAPKADEKHREFMDGLRKAMELARAFKYPELNIELGRLGAIAVADDAKLAEFYTAIAKEEQDLVGRCRTRLIDQIQRHPRHESPLQVFPRKNDPQGDDIIDFDGNGLKIQQRAQGRNPPVLTTKSWERIPPAQALALVSLLAPERSNVEDQIGLAAFAFNRGLTQELESALNFAKAIPTSKDRAEAFAEKIAALRKALEK